VFQTGTRWHVRVVGADGVLCPHGGLGVDTVALCGLEMARGWDLSPAVTVDAVRGLLARNKEARPGWEAICPGCADEYVTAATA